MYAYITGKITSILPTNIVIDNNGIGYIIIVPNPYSFSLFVTETVFTHQVIKEDSNNIYGFKSLEEKALFLTLLGVSGIGPKSALSMLASGSVSGIKNAIVNRDSAYLKKFPGIGEKSSAQIILDLAGKLEKTSTKEALPNESDDTFNALLALGYKKRAIEKALSLIDMSGDTQTKIKLALKAIVE